MKKLNLLWVLALALFVFAACQKDDVPQPVEEPLIDQTAINASGLTAQGAGYELTNVVFNPALRLITGDNATLNSIDNESLSVAFNDNTTVVAGNVLFIDVDGVKAIRRVENVALAGGIYSITTSDGSLGDVIGQGTIGIDVDLSDFARAAATRAGIDVYNDIIDLHDDLTLGNLTFNPDSYVGMGLRFDVEFKSNARLPQRVELIYKLDLAVNPRLSFDAACDNTYSFDLTDYIPSFLMDLLLEQSFDIDVPLQMLFYNTTIPLSISIADLRIPTVIETAVAADATIGFGYNGHLEAGFRLTRNGTGYKSDCIWSNSIKPSIPVDAQLYGELFTSSDVIITPEIELFGESNEWLVSSIMLGLDTENFGYYQHGNGLAFASRGDLRTAIDVQGFFSGTDYRVLENMTPLWDFGTGNYVTFSGLSYENVAAAVDEDDEYKMTTTFRLRYAYPMMDKGVPDGLTLAFDVYAADRLTGIRLQRFSIPLDAASVADGVITFDADIPYYKNTIRGAFSGNIITQTHYTESHIRHLKLTDAAGNEYPIYDGAGNVLPPEVPWYNLAIYAAGNLVERKAVGEIAF